MDIPKASEEIAVLGGGLAGLAAGMRAQAPVFEASDHVGGVAASDTVEGFTFDRGIHVLQTRNQKILDLLDDLGIELGVRERSAHIYSHGCFTAYPFQINTAGLPISLRANCVWDFFTRDREAEPDNYEQWMYATLGRGFAETFLIPYSEKFWTVHPRELTHDWTGNRVPTPSAAQVLRGALWNRQTRIGTNAVFRYPQRGGGYGSVAEALARRVPAIRLQHRATELDLESKRLAFEDGSSIGFETLISTIPLPVLVGIARHVPDEVRQAAARLRANSIMLVNLGIAADDVSDHHWVHFPEPDVSFFRISYPHNFDPEVAPPGMSSISAEVAFSKERPIDRDTIVDRVIADLIRVGAMKAEHSVVVKTTCEVPLAYCIYDQHRKNAVRCISNWLEEHDVLTCGRYGLWSYFWSDEAMMSGMNTADKALKRLGAAAPELLAAVERG